ncbi:MAG: tRNA dihydrouridine synthase DusB [Burkholderiales bacterium]|nr:tRNA dihydrouridine synthase DusB [Burkholderiales bacterium]
MNASSFVTANTASDAFGAAIMVGSHCIGNGLALAPMAGLTDKPFRALCRRLVAHYGELHKSSDEAKPTKYEGLCSSLYTVAEMISAQPHLRHSKKSRWRTDYAGESTPIVVQLVGNGPAQMAEAARHSVACGAHIIDINMGCPAKKVCNAAAGSALLADESRVAHILTAVVRAVEVPVTLKFRTGVSSTMRNAVRVARLAEDAGIAMLALHGRTRACAFTGSAEYETIAAVKRAVRIPVLANGDIDSPHKALRVLHETGADGVMIGRAALGQPWLFRDIAHFAAYGVVPLPLTLEERLAVIDAHLTALYEFYGEMHGVRIARKHLGYYLRHFPALKNFAENRAQSLRQHLNVADTATAQRAALLRFFDAASATVSADAFPYPKVA